MNTYYNLNCYIFILWHIHSLQLSIVKVSFSQTEWNAVFEYLCNVNLMQICIMCIKLMCIYIMLNLNNVNVPLHADLIICMLEIHTNVTLSQCAIQQIIAFYHRLSFDIGKSNVYVIGQQIQGTQPIPKLDFTLSLLLNRSVNNYIVLCIISFSVLYHSLYYIIFCSLCIIYCQLLYLGLNQFVQN